MSIRAETSFSLKDDLFNKHTVTELGGALARASRRFQRKRFERSVLSAFPDLELKARIDHMVDVLGNHLPDDVPEALNILQRALPPPLDPTLSDDDFGSFIWVVPGEYAARHGCNRTDLSVSLSFLRETTKRFSAENAIRPFLHNYPDQTLKFLKACTRDDNYHVRRLASEGTRPLLPWSMKVELPVQDSVEILARLHADPTRYVTRSVANHLNDLSKSDPDLVISTLKDWQARKQQSEQELDWMIRHALRTLIKQDYPPALNLLGYPSRPKISIDHIDIASQVKVGDNLGCKLQITSNARQRLLVTLRVHFLKANGRHSPKVFTVAKTAVEKGARLELSKTIAFRPMTTRVLYPGRHLLDVVVNGVTKHQHAFELVP